MGAIANGIAAYGPNLMIPAIGTFLNFVSYAAGAVRLSALSHQRVIWVATHDSIGLGVSLNPSYRASRIDADFFLFRFFRRMDLLTNLSRLSLTSVLFLTATSGALLVSSSFYSFPLFSFFSLSSTQLLILSSLLNRR